MMAVMKEEDEVERIDERVQHSKVLNRGRYNYLGKVIIKEENLRDQMEKASKISKSIY